MIAVDCPAFRQPQRRDIAGNLRPPQDGSPAAPARCPRLSLFDGRQNARVTVSPTAQPLEHDASDGKQSFRRGFA